MNIKKTFNSSSGMVFQSNKSLKKINKKSPPWPIVLSISISPACDSTEFNMAGLLGIEWGSKNSRRPGNRNERKPTRRGLFSMVDLTGISALSPFLLFPFPSLYSALPIYYPLALIGSLSKSWE